jgi:hypothetical protein
MFGSYHITPCEDFYHLLWASYHRLPCLVVLVLLTVLLVKTCVEKCVSHAVLTPQIVSANPGPGIAGQHRSGSCGGHRRSPCVARPHDRRRHLRSRREAPWPPGGWLVDLEGTLG